MRRRFPWWLLVVAFVVVPLVEIYVIVQVGQVIGAWWTIVLLIADSILGSWLVKREGGRAWEALRVALEQRRMPHRELADGMLVLVGGLLMLTPGFVLDVVGVLCILPVTRPVARRLLAGVIGRRLAGATAGVRGPAAFGGPFGGSQDPWTRRRPGTDTSAGDGADGVVRGEVVDEGPGPRRPGTEGPR
ncbi:MAG: FxsA family protein [Marmoricola sp.]|nr:FxsA family protein [Marmoricola sp.]